VVYATSEAAPYAKSGHGLADVLGKAPVQLAALGADVSVIMPRYRTTLGFPMTLVGHSEVIHMNGYTETPEVYAAKLPGSEVPVYLISDLENRLFDRDKLYGHFDDLERFAFFNLALIRFLKSSGKNPPDVIFCHDWHTGLLPVYLKTIHKEDPFFRDTKTIFTLHDIAFQGLFPKAIFGKTGLGWQHYVPEKLQYHEWVSLLKAGLYFADAACVRTQDYLAKIQSREHGRGFDEIARDLSQAGSLVGILPSDSIWNPNLPFTPELAEAWARRELGLIRSLLNYPFKGMRFAAQTSPARTWLFQTTSERLSGTNRKAADLYAGLGDTDRIFVREFVAAGQEHLFKEIETAEELEALLSDIRGIDLGSVGLTQDMIRRFIATRGASNAPTGEIKLMESIPPLPQEEAAFRALVEIGREGMQKLCRITLAGGAAARFFGGRPYPKGVYETELGSFFRIQAEDISKAQNKYGIGIPWYILVSPGEFRKIVEGHFSDNKFFGLKEEDLVFFEVASRFFTIRRNERLFMGFYGEQDKEIIAAEHSSLLPVLDEEGKIVLTADRRIRFAPPGHGILFASLFQAKIIEDALRRGREHAFISNIDNLAADVSSDYYAAVLGYHLSNQSKFTAELVDPEPGEPPGGVGIVLDGRRQIGEQFILPTKLRERTQQEGAPFNPVNYTIDLAYLIQLIHEGRLELPWWLEAKMDKPTGIRTFQRNTLAGDYSTLVEPKLIRSPRRFRFIPVKEQESVRPAVERYRTKLGDGEYK
jgi:UDP-N-acetylglucosamine pyrophosphorylase